VYAVPPEEASMDVPADRLGSGPGESEGLSPTGFRDAATEEVPAEGRARDDTEDDGRAQELDDYVPL
jgi:hypothetical protein